MKITFGEYEEKDRGYVIDLLKRTFPGSSDDQTFCWRFETPYHDDAIMVCAKDCNRVVSFNSWLPWKFSYHGITLTGYQSGESATDLVYRGKGIWREVIRVGKEIAQKKGVDFLFGFPSLPSYNVLKKEGYVPIGKLNFRVKLLNPFSIGDSCEMLKKNFFENMPFFFQGDRITPLVNHEYMDWRYIENTKSYKLLGYNEHDNKALFVVRFRKWRGINEAVLLDFLFNSKRDSFVKNSFDYLFRHLQRKTAWMRTFYVKDSLRGSILKKIFKFKVNSRYEILMVQPLSEKINKKDLLNIINWDIMPHCVDSY